MVPRSTGVSSRASAFEKRGARWVLALMLAVGLIAVPALPASAADPAGSTDGGALWRALPAISATRGAVADLSLRAYRSFSLSAPQMRAMLAGAPLEFTPAAASPLILSLPAPGGGFVRFAVQESPIVAPELAVRFPFVKTYNGQGIDDPAATIRLDMGRTGFHAQVLSPHGDWYVDPYFRLDQSVYVTYFERDLVDTHGPFRKLHPAGHEHLGRAPASSPTAARVVGSQLRTYRTAVAATGEYSAFHGGTVPLVHNAIVTAVNRVTGVYERELAIRLELVANNDNLIYLNAATDPYSNSNPSALLNQNQSNVDAVIGNANYDVGHVFSTGGGGLAALAVVGKTGQKARGETGLSSPTGDAFYIDYVAHELGHQFAGNHTFNGTRGSCSGNANGATAMEPGSGTTIMAYAGICGLDDLQPHSDDYFHAVSFDEIVAYTTTPGSPGNLGAAPSGNTPPVVSVDGGPFTIPLRTPFQLSATGSDADGDALSYTWEQYDGGALRALDAASKPTGVLFRSFAPQTTPVRVFPSMTSVLAGTTNAGTGTCPALPGGLSCWAEFLPTSSRTMNFRVTVRDNDAAAGGVSSANVAVTTSSTGPFLVTSPNTAVTLPGGSTQAITWSVAGTNGAPVNTATVDILLSTDGGLSFPTALATATPNDGSQTVVLPNVTTGQARVMVEAVGNVFFDVSDADFTITAGGNQPPVATGDSATTPVDTAVAIDVLGNDTDADGTLVPASVSIVTPPVHGSTGVNLTDGVVTYTPALGFAGADSFEYTVEDDDGAVSAAATVSVTVGSAGTIDVFPSSVTVETGGLVGGSASSLGADDGSYVTVRAPKGGTSVAWYGTLAGVDDAASSLAVAYDGRASTTCTQTVAMYRWTDASWVTLDSRSVSTTDVSVAGLAPPGAPADFVSGTSGPGDVRVRIRCTGPTGLTVSGDLMKLSVTSIGGGSGTLNVSSAGSGSGVVTSSPAGIDCGADCSESYSDGTLVTLTATPDPGSTFTGWSGACSGTGTCQVTISGSLAATATFASGGGPTDVLPSAYSIQSGALGGGTVSSLYADDGDLLLVRAKTAATWFATFTGVDDAVASLTATYRGSSSVSCTQTVSIFRWADSTWVTLDSRSIGTTETEIGGLVPPGSPSDYVSGSGGPGDVRVRVSCSAATAFTLSAEFLKITVA